MTLRKQLIVSFIVTISLTTILFYILYKLMWFDGRFAIFLTLCSLLSAMVTLVLGLFFTVPTIKKIERLNDQTQKVAEGHFDVTGLNIRSPREIQELSMSFDQMVTKVQKQMAMIKDEQTEKIQLIQNLAHDLKTPLASIKSYSEGLKDGIIHGDQATQKAYGVLIEQADRLSQMFDELTDVMTINHSTHTSTLIHMDQLLLPILESYTQRLQQEQRTLNVDIDKHIDPFHQNQQALERILMNIMDNALKFSEAGTSIDIQVTQTEDQHIAIAITDQGIGIAETDLPRIFERTYRVEQSRHKTTGGSGLGLYIAKTLSEQLDGDIKVDSELGHGTTVTVYVPTK